MRNLKKGGSVWGGTFVKLRDDAPNIVAANDQEHEINLSEGDHVIEKVHFLLYEKSNVLVWQVNRAVGTFTRAEDYLSALFRAKVVLAYVMNEEKLNDLMNGHLYEIDFAYDRPKVIPRDVPLWSKTAGDMMGNVDAAHAKFTFRAPRKGHLGARAIAVVREILNTQEATKVRVRLTDEVEPIELFMAPLKDTISLVLRGRYPLISEAFSELSEAYDRNKAHIRDAFISETPTI